MQAAARQRIADAEAGGRQYIPADEQAAAAGGLAGSQLTTIQQLYRRGGRGRRK